MALCLPLQPFQALKVRKLLQRRMPKEVTKLVFEYVLTHAKFAAQVLRHFKFIPTCVQSLKERATYLTPKRPAIMIWPQFRHHLETLVGYKGEVEFTDFGFSYVPRTEEHRRIIDLSDTDSDMLYGILLDTEGLNEGQVVGIRNGLQKSTWVRYEKSVVLERYFNGEERDMAFAMVAAGLRSFGNQNCLSEGLESHAIMTMYEEDKPFIKTHEEQKYPLMELAILGALMKHPDSYKNINFISSRNFQSMAVLWKTVQIMEEDMPDLKDRFVKYIKCGLRKKKLRRTDLTDRIVHHKELAVAAVSRSSAVVEEDLYSDSDSESEQAIKKRKTRA
jgi:hypothetical protein